MTSSCFVYLPRVLYRATKAIISCFGTRTNKTTHYKFLVYILSRILVYQSGGNSLVFVMCITHSSYFVLQLHFLTELQHPCCLL